MLVQTLQLLKHRNITIIIPKGTIFLNNTNKEYNSTNKTVEYDEDTYSAHNSHLVDYLDAPFNIQ